MVRLKQPLFGLLDSYLRVHLGKRPFGISSRMWKSHIKMEVGRCSLSRIFLILKYIGLI